MAHFAELDSNNKVIRVIVLDDEHQNNGQEFCRSVFNTTNSFVQTSYNTIRGEHRLGGTPFRKNYASVGYTYDTIRDAFIPPKPYNSWILNENTCTWDPPIPWPGEQGANTTTVWDEKNVSWKTCQVISISELSNNETAVFDTELLEWKIVPGVEGTK